MDTRDRKQDLGLGPLQSEPGDDSQVVPTKPKSGFKTKVSSQGLRDEKTEAKPEASGGAGPAKG